MSWVTNAVSGSASQRNTRPCFTPVFYHFFLEKSYCARGISIRNFLTDRKILLGVLFFSIHRNHRLWRNDDNNFKIILEFHGQKL